MAILVITSQRAGQIRNHNTPKKLEKKKIKYVVIAGFEWKTFPAGFTKANPVACREADNKTDGTKRRR